MNQQRSHETIMPPRRLADKVSRGDGPELSDIVARAEAALEVMKDDYTASVHEDLAAFYAALDAIKASRGEIRAEALKRVYQVSHDMRTQGKTFGYPLITQIGSSLCDFIETHGEAAATRPEVIDAHGGAMRAVIAAKVTGDGGAIGQKLVSDINALVAKAVKKLAAAD